MQTIYEILEEIGNASGNDKISIMKRNPDIQFVLLKAYHPFKRYHMTAPEIDGLGDLEIINSDGSLTDGTRQILDNLSTRGLSGDDANQVVCDFITYLDKESAELFKKIINKDLRIGINISTINKAFPNLISQVEDGSEKIPVMLLKNFNPKTSKFPLMIAPKIDGVRGRFLNGNMYSRNGKIIKGLGRIIKELESKGSDFDGELTVPGLSFDEASGLIRSNEDTPEAVYNIFDMPSESGSKMDRYRKSFTILNPNMLDFVKLINTIVVYTIEELFDKYNSYLDEGYEGAVVYDPESLYEDKRSSDWVRLVPMKSADCKVVGAYEGEGKFAGSLGGIIVDYNGNRVRVGSGFTSKSFDELTENQKAKIVCRDSYDSKVRSIIWGNPDRFKCATAEITFKQETATGSMRHPIFKCWRWDKVYS